MEITVKTPKECERVLEVTLPASQVKEKIDKLYEKYQRKLRIDGFRKGKVPIHIIKGRFEESIKEEAMDETIKEAYKEAIEEKKLSPISQALVKERKFSDEEGFSFKIAFDVLPDISPKDYKEIKVKYPSTEVSKKEIEYSLSKLQDSKATYAPLVTRSALPGDMLIVDYEILYEEKGIIRKNKVSNYSILLDTPGVPEEITNALVKSMPGDRRKASVRYPTDFKDEKLRGQLVEYDFLVRELKKKELPEINDEFAKDVGFNSLQELTQRIKEELKKEKEKVSKTKIETQILNSLIDDNPFTAPDSIVRAYLEPMLKRGGEKIDQDTRKSLEEIAIWRAKREILLDKIAELEKIEFTDEEMKSKLLEDEECQRMGYQRTVKTLKEKGIFESLREEFRRGKVIGLLVKKEEKI